MSAETQYLDFATPGTLTRGTEGATIASASTIAPVKRMHPVSGTTQITLITLPYDGFEGEIALFPTGAFTGATGGSASGLNKAIGLAFTAVTGRVLKLNYLKSTGLWYPSYVS